MDQYLSQMTMQMTVPPTTSAQPAPKSEAPQDNQFQKLVDQKREALDSEAPARQQPVKDQSGDVQEGQEKPPVQEDAEPTNEQMMLAAAYAAAQAVVIPMEEAERLPENMLQGPVEALPMGSLEAAGVVAEVAQDLPQNHQAEVPVQEAPQGIPVEAPQAAVEAEAPVVTRQAHPEEAQPLEQPQVQDTQAQAPVKETPVPTQVIQKEETPTEAAVQPQPVFREVEAAPVKVGETAQPQETPEDTGVEQQLGQRIGQAIQQGETKVELQLNPASLGSVRVELTRGVDGAIRVMVGASNPSTQSLLERHAAGLQGMLSTNNNQEVHVEVQHQENPNAHQQPDYDGHNGQPQQEQEERRQNKDKDQHSSQDFLQQLRLGLIPLE